MIIIPIVLPGQKMMVNILDLCTEFSSLSGLDESPEAALIGIRNVVSEVAADLRETGEQIPVPIANRNYSGKFMVRIPLIHIEFLLLKRQKQVLV